MALTVIEDVAETKSSGRSTQAHPFWSLITPPGWARIFSFVTKEDIVSFCAYLCPLRGIYSLNSDPFKVAFIDYFDLHCFSDLDGK